MKKSLLQILIMACAAFLCACSNNKPFENVPENIDEQPSLKPGIYKFMASELKGRWEEGDVIYIKGGTGATAQSIIIKSSDLTDNGKTANLELDESLTSDYLDPDGLYAAWPDDAIQHKFGVLTPKTSFNNCTRPVCVAYLDGYNFKFIDASSAIDFSASGYDGYAFSAASREGFAVTKADVEYTSSRKKISPKESNGYPFLYGDVAKDGNTRIQFTGDVTMKGGYTLFLSKGGSWIATYSVTDDIALKAGEAIDLGDITSKVSKYDGPAPKMPVMGKFKKFTVKKFAELSGLCLSENEDFLWGVGDEGDLGKISFEGELLYSFHIGGDAEDISRNPETGDLLIGLEPQGIGIVKGPDYNTRVSTHMNISACSGYGNSGIEGLTYYKDGKVLAGAQANSHLFLCDLSTKKVIWDKMLWSKELISEIGGICYDPLTDWLWLIDSEAKKIFVVTVDENDGTIGLLGAYSVKDVANPESVCVDHKNSCVWVGDDLGDETSYLFRYDFTGLDDAVTKR